MLWATSTPVIKDMGDTDGWTNVFFRAVSFSSFGGFGGYGATELMIGVAMMVTATAAVAAAAASLGHLALE